jgi:DNA mismatch repair protein MSH5
MAVDMRHRDTVGCCYFVARDEKLYLMEDVQLGGADIVDACESPKQSCADLAKLMAVVRTYIDPTIVLISTSTDDAVLDQLDPEGLSGASVSGESKCSRRKHAAGLMLPDDQFRLPFLLEVRPPAEFSYDAAQSKLVSLNLSEDQGSRVNFFVPGDMAVDHSAYDPNAVPGQHGKLLRMAGLVDMDSCLTVWICSFHLVMGS